MNIKQCLHEPSRPPPLTTAAVEVMWGERLILSATTQERGSGSSRLYGLKALRLVALLGDSSPATKCSLRHLALRRDLRPTQIVRGPPVSKKRECCALTAVPRVHSTLVCVIAPSHARAESHASFQVVRISSDRRRGEEALALRVDPHEAEHWTA